MKNPGGPTDLRTPAPPSGWWYTLVLLSVSISVFAAGPYLAFDPAASNIPINSRAPLHFVVLAAHAVTGGIALFIGPFQFLHRLRTRRPVVHRAPGACTNTACG